MDSFRLIALLVARGFVASRVAGPLDHLQGVYAEDLLALRGSLEGTMVVMRLAYSAEADEWVGTVGRMHAGAYVEVMVSIDEVSDEAADYLAWVANAPERWFADAIAAES